MTLANAEAIQLHLQTQNFGWREAEFKINLSLTEVKTSSDIIEM